jgi:hypothetical protein
MCTSAVHAHRLLGAAQQNFGAIVTWPILQTQHEHAPALRSMQHAAATTAEH